MSLRFLRSRWVWMPIVSIALLAIVVSFFRDSDDSPSVDFSEVIALAADGEVARIEVRGSELRVQVFDRDGITTYRSRVGQATDVYRALTDTGIPIGGEAGVELSYVEPRAPWFAFGLYVVELGLLIAVLVYVVRIYRLQRDRTNEDVVLEPEA